LDYLLPVRLNPYLRIYRFFPIQAHKGGRPFLSDSMGSSRLEKKPGFIKIHAIESRRRATVLRRAMMPEGGQNTITELFAGHGRKMLESARAIIKSDADAEDVVQEVLLSLIKAPHSLLAVERIGAWLYTQVKRRCIDFIRSRKRRRRKETDTGIRELVSFADPGGRIEDEELSRTIASAVESLPVALRDVFVSNMLEEKTFREISAESGVPMGTLMARKRKALEIIRAKLEKEGFILRKGVTSHEGS